MSNWVKKDTMIRTGFGWWTIAIASAFLCSVGCAGGEGSQAGTIAPAPAGIEDSSGRDPADGWALEDVLAAIQAEPVPDGIEPELWERMTAELARVLEEQAHPNGKFTSDAPVSDASAAALSWDGEASTLSWGYNCQGDYDQNGEVNISDLTPLGMHFGKSGGFAPDSIEAVVDGDANGEINIADVTPIGINFKRVVDQYNVYQSLSLGDMPGANGEVSTFTPLASLEMSLATGSPAAQRLRFTHVLDSPLSNANYWVRPADGEHEGTPSNPVNIGSLNVGPTASFSATPEQGDAPLTVQFDASASLDPDGQIVKHEWDWDGLANGLVWFDSGAEAIQSHEYADPGTYLPILRVTDDDGATDAA
ncbi:hypothetical protein IIA79_08350, partial [bacterium]|nr:hypothetical protein [bacterium]